MSVRLPFLLTMVFSAFGCSASPDSSSSRGTEVAAQGEPDGGQGTTDAVDGDGGQKNEDEGISKPVAISGSNLTFTVEKGIDLKSVKGYVVGFPGKLLLETYPTTDGKQAIDDAGDPMFVIKNVPAGEHDVILTAGEVALSTALTGPQPLGVRLAKVKVTKGKTTHVKKVVIPPVGSIKGVAKKFNQTDHELIQVAFPGTNIPIGVTDKNGNYTLTGIPVGVHELALSAGDAYGVEHLTGFEVKSAQQATAPLVTLYPKGGALGEIVINAGVALTDSKTVQVELRTSSSAIQWRMSEDSFFSGVALKTVDWKGKKTVVHTFANEGVPGTSKTLYVEFVDAAGRTAPASASIRIDSLPPTQPATMGWEALEPLRDDKFKAEWTPSVDADLASQAVQVFEGANCDTTTALGGAVAASATSYSFAATFGKTYTYKIVSTDDLGHSDTTDCSAEQEQEQYAQLLGEEHFSTGEGKAVDLAFDGAHAPHVAYNDVPTSQKAAVKKFDGSAWVDVGTNPSTGAGRATRLLHDGTDFFLAYRDGSNSSGATVRKFDGSTWSTVGFANFSGASALELDMIYAGGDVYVAYQEEDVNTDQQCTVRKMNAGAWDLVGTAMFTTPTCNKPTLAVSGSDVYLGFQTVAGDAKVMKFDGANWADVGTLSLFGTGGKSSVKLAVDSSNVYATMVDGSDGSKVKMWYHALNGSGDWVAFGASVSDGPANYPSVVSSGNRIWVSFVNTSSGDIALRRYSSSAWRDLMPPAPIAATNIDLNVHQGIAYIAAGEGAGVTVFKVIRESDP